MDSTHAHFWGWRPWWILGTDVLALALCFMFWPLRIHTNLARQYYPRTLIALELIPLLAIALSIVFLSTQAPWIVRTSPRRMGLHAGTRATLSLAPAVALPLLTGLLLRNVPINWLPGAEALEPVDLVPIAEQLPWDFFVSLIPILLTCAGAGLLAESVLGRSLGCIAPLMTYGAVVLLQSHGHLDFFAGFPGIDITKAWEGFAFGAVSLSLGLGAFALSRGGATGRLNP